ncbi:MAG TPA: DUF4386 domain-containing protein [Bradyrhizobium sp.]|nr:DUF4386 domain-containing protein [Bradyrhizobium sp.]
MSATAMAGPITGTATPRFKANVAGILYFANMLAFVPAAYVHSRFVIPAGTAAAASDALVIVPLYRFGLTFDLIAVASGIAVTALFFDLFKPVSGRLSLFAAYVNLMGCAITAASCLIHFVPLAILRATEYFPIFATKLEPVALLFLKMRVQTANIGIVFAGVYCILIGFLILRSSFLPKPLGVLMAVAGLGWLTYLSPSLASELAPLNSLVSGLLGEGSLMLWLLVIGVNVQRTQAALASPK